MPRRASRVFPVGAVAIVLFLLLCALGIVSAGSEALARVYQWTDEKGVIHFGNKPPPVTPEPTRASRREAEKEYRSQIGLAPAGQGAEPTSTPAPPWSVTAGQTLRHVYDCLDRVDSDALTKAFNYFESTSPLSEVTASKVRVRDKLDQFHALFGRVLDIAPVDIPGPFVKIGVVDSAPESAWNAVQPECAMHFASARLPRDNATAIVGANVCRAGGRFWLRDLVLGLDNPSDELKAKVAVLAGVFGAPVPGQTEPPAEAKNTGADASQKPAASPQAQDSQSVRPPSVAGPLAGLPFPGGALNLPHPGSMPPFPPGQMLALLGLFSGTMLVLPVAIGLFFYFFQSLCLYLIARKLGVPNAGLAWVPIANVHTMVCAAGKSWVWTALLLAPMLSAIPLLLIPCIIIALVDIVLFAMIWMAICSRMGLSKWLGLVIYVPLLQFVLLAFLAFKPEITQAPYSLKRVLLITLVVYLALTALGAGALWMVVAPMLRAMRPALSQTMPPATPTLPRVAVSPSKPAAPDKGQPAPAAQTLTPTTDEPSLDRAGYQARLDVPAPEFDTAFEADRPQQAVGPVRLKLSQFWPDDQSPHVWIKVRIPVLPFLELSDSGTLTVTSVLDSTGREIYDRDNGFETGDSFSTLRFSPQTSPSPCLEALRDVYLKPGATDASLAVIKGVVTLSLPLNVTTVVLRKADLGRTVTQGPLQLTLEKLDGQAFQLRIAGPSRLVLDPMGYSGAGQRLDRTEWSSWGSEEVQTVSGVFDAEAAELRIPIATESVETSFPFTLGSRQ